MPNLPKITMVTTDHDIAVRVASLFGTGVYNASRKKGKPHWKQAYQLKLTGYRAVEMMKELKPLMGQRRQQQIARALASYEPQTHKVTFEIYQEAKKFLQSGKTHSQIGNELGLCRETVCKLLKRFNKKEETPVKKIGDKVTVNCSWRPEPMRNPTNGQSYHGYSTSYEYPSFVEGKVSGTTVVKDGTSGIVVRAGSPTGHATSDIPGQAPGEPGPFSNWPGRKKAQPNYHVLLDDEREIYVPAEDIVKSFL